MVCATGRAKVRLVRPVGASAVVVLRPRVGALVCATGRAKVSVEGPVGAVGAVGASAVVVSRSRAGAERCNRCGWMLIDSRGVVTLCPPSCADGAPTGPNGQM